jgi:hypothetical protein
MAVHYFFFTKKFKMFSRLSRKLVEIKKAREVQNENDFTFGKKPSFFGGSIGCEERRRKKS